MNSYVLTSLQHFSQKQQNSNLNLDDRGVPAPLSVPAPVLVPGAVHLSVHVHVYQLCAPIYAPLETYLDIDPANSGSCNNLFRVRDPVHDPVDHILNGCLNGREGSYCDLMATWKSVGLGNFLTFSSPIETHYRNLCQMKARLSAEAFEHAWFKV